MPDLISLLLVLTVGYVTLYGVIVAQAFAISRANRIAAWKLVAFAFMIAALVQVWRMLQLPIAILQAKVQGTLPERLTWEQWISIVGAYIWPIIIIVAFDKIRRDYRNIGL